MPDEGRPRINQFDGERSLNGSMATRESFLNANRVDHVATSLDKVYADDEAEFLSAVRNYQEKTRRKYPTFTELFSVMKAMGYERREDHS
jgi:hypothetical protein